MGCVNCDKIRKAILHGKMAEAAGLTVDVLREKFGLKEGQPTDGFVDAPLAMVGNGDPEAIVVDGKDAKVKVAK